MVLVFKMIFQESLYFVIAHLQQYISSDCFFSQKWGKNKEHCEYYCGLTLKRSLSVFCSFELKIALIYATYGKESVEFNPKLQSLAFSANVRFGFSWFRKNMFLGNCLLSGYLKNEMCQKGHTATARFWWKWP